MTDEKRSEAARLMGRAKSKKKERAARKNAEKAGRPKGSKDSYQRTRGKGKTSKGMRYEPAED